MPEHGELDPQSQQNKWFCGYWMTREEWEDVHDYAPPSSAIVEQQEEKEEEQEEEEG